MCRRYNANGTGHLKNIQVMDACGIDSKIDCWPRCLFVLVDVSQTVH